MGGWTCEELKNPQMLVIMWRIDESSILYVYRELTDLKPSTTKRTM